MIVTAAIKINNVVYTGRRHDDAIKNATDEKGKQIKSDSKYTCGFVTSEGTFLNRTQASIHAYMYGQIKTHSPNDILISEQLYTDNI